MHTIPAIIANRIKVSESGCWEWTAGTDTHGYAQPCIEGRYQLLHRWTYATLVGPIPKGLELDHICRVRHCVNPAHLEPVTHRQNVLRGEGVAAIAARTTHCPEGHEYAGGNLIVYSDGKRRCRECRNTQARARYNQKAVSRRG